MTPSLEQAAGCLLGGAVGDALGAPVEFLSLDKIRKQFGPQGIRHYAPAYGRLGAITDDTQLTLFTLEGLQRALTRFNCKGICNPVAVMHRAYLRWMGTQGKLLPAAEAEGVYGGWLWDKKELHACRAPGNSCLTALESGKLGTTDDPINDSKGCGAVMRMAPVGLLPVADPFQLGSKFGALTHGHPTGYLAAGFLAQLIAELAADRALRDSISVALDVLTYYPRHEECLAAITHAVTLASQSDSASVDLAVLGEGWVAEEAVAISVFCSLTATDFTDGVCRAVNHSGDSDSTGAITGNILGALFGANAIPEEYLQHLEMRDVIEQMARDIVVPLEESAQWSRYPGY